MALSSVSDAGEMAQTLERQGTSFDFIRVIDDDFNNEEHEDEEEDDMSLFQGCVR